MDVKASLRHLRMAPRKVRLVVDVIRGMSVTDAETRLKFVQKDAARPVLKLLQSAIANAEHNFKLDRAALYVQTITADGGTTLKRSRPRAMGRAAPIRKRTTHINIVLSDVRKEKPPVAPRKFRGKKVAKPQTNA
jgi:large subunit ribosomal protein L22